jgi:hypothetical protein
VGPEFARYVHNGENVIVERGFMGRAGTMRAIAPSTPPHAFPQTLEPKCELGQQLGKGSLHKGWARIQLNPSLV